MTTTLPVDAQDLDDRGDSGNDRGSEHRPRQIGFRRASGAAHDGHLQEHAANGKQGELEAEADGQEQRRPFVRFVTNA